MMQTVISPVAFLFSDNNQQKAARCGIVAASDCFLWLILWIICA